tara:strand:- start:1738 stop:2988 length:1251 start_codon:yes stop_codon:yes gene_type:complete
MSYDARVSAARYRFEQLGAEPEIYRMDSGYRIEHLRQQYTDIYRRVIRAMDGYGHHDRFRQGMESEGVKITTLRKMFDGYRNLRLERESLRPKVEAEQEKNIEREFDRRRFSTEYIGLTDFRILEIDSDSDRERLEGGIFYKSKLDAEIKNDGTWGIVIDLVGVYQQFRDISENSAFPPPDELFGALLMFNIFHEHFHYLTELAAIKLAGPGRRFALYQQYLNNANWVKWDCKLEDCSKQIEDEVRKFVAQTPFACKCKDKGIIQAEIGYQYPVEEAMANAYASKQFMKLVGKQNGWRQMMPYIEEYIVKHNPLGYAEFDRFKATRRFQLGQRIMTRLLSGVVGMPEINILQHQLIEGEVLTNIINKEESLFSGLERVENAYQDPIVPDEMAEIPVIILNCDQFPDWWSYIGNFLS